MATTKISYPGLVTLDVTNLHSLATSATWVAGWEGPTVDNSSNLYVDYLVSGFLALGNSATAGQIRVYIVPTLDDTVWPNVFDGTQSTETWGDVTLRDAACVLGFACDTRADPGTDDVYPIKRFSVSALFGGSCPKKFAPYVTHSTGVNLASSGSSIVLEPILYTTV